jgi:exodeoxyribonuclease V alpha subunit
MSLTEFTATIDRIRHHQPSPYNNGLKYLIASTRDGNIVKGLMETVAECQEYKFFGEWRPSKPWRGQPQPDYFDFVSYEAMVDRSEAGIAQYLRTHVKGLGHVLANRLAAEFEADTLDILRTDPDKALAVKGIIPAIIASIKQHFDDESRYDPAAYAKIIDLFNTAGVRVYRKVIEALLDAWRSAAPERIVKYPYSLLALPGMGWKTVDTFAQSNVVGYDPKGIDRHKGSILEALRLVHDDGHTQAGRVEVQAGAYKLLGHTPRDEAWFGLVEDGDILAMPPSGHIDDPVLWSKVEDATGWKAAVDIDPDAVFSLPEYAEAESSISYHLDRIARTARPLPFPLRSERLHPDQQAALDVIAANPVAILTGPPGVGKSYVVAELVRCLKANGVRKVHIVAPMGKAAKRADELVTAAGTRVPCTTIHKALVPTLLPTETGIPQDSAKLGRGRRAWGFAHTEDNPLDVEWIIVDESSMIECTIGSSFFKAIPSGARLLIVGDENQLPSVGPGAVLRDLIAAGVPTARLTRIVRSDGGGRVVRACHDIIAGRMPEPATRLELPTENWVHFEVSDPNEIASTIVDLVKPYASFSDPLWDIQVISPQHAKFPFSCNNLNELLSNKLNQRPEIPIGPGVGSEGEGDSPESPKFIVGDKVIRRKNGLIDEMVPMNSESGWDESRRRHVDWEWQGTPFSFQAATVVNGDLGIVEDIVKEGRSIYVVVRNRTPEFLYRVPMSECYLQRAYAVTVHSFQGSGAPVIICPLSTQFFWRGSDATGDGIWCRELVYTMISRTEAVLITVGNLEALRVAIRRKTVNRRRTRLETLVRQAMNGTNRGADSRSLPSPMTEDQVNDGDETTSSGSGHGSSGAKRIPVSRVQRDEIDL